MAQQHHEKMKTQFDKKHYLQKEGLTYHPQNLKKQQDNLQYIYMFILEVSSDSMLQ